MKGAKILFEDEVLFQQEGTTRQSWAKRGKGFTVYRHPCKKKIKFYGAITIEKSPTLIFQRADWFNTKTFQKFLEYILSEFDKVFLILDNVGYHKAKKLDEFLKLNKKRLWLHFLPTYSPELNAIEPVWKETRKDATHNRYFPTLKRLTRTVQTQFRIYQKEPWKLSGIVAPFY